jgi:hypothetical protein
VLRAWDERSCELLPLLAGPRTDGDPANHPGSSRVVRPPRAGRRRSGRDRVTPCRAEPARVLPNPSILNERTVILRERTRTS